MINYQTLTVDNCPNCISVSYKNIWIVHRIKNSNLLPNDAFWAGPATIFKICKNTFHEFYVTGSKLGHCATFKSFWYRKNFPSKVSRLKRQWFIFLNSHLSRYRLSVILIHFKNCLFRKLGPQTSLDPTLLCVETRIKVSFRNHKSFLQATTMTRATFFHPSYAAWLMRHCCEKVPVKFNYRTGKDSL